MPTTGELHVFFIALFIQQLNALVVAVIIPVVQEIALTGFHFAEGAGLNEIRPIFDTFDFLSG